MMLLTGYASKAQLKAAIGQPLRYRETSMFGNEFRADGKFCAAHRPAITGLPGREFFANITMADGKIAKVA